MPTSALPAYIMTGAHRASSPSLKSVKRFSFPGSTAGRFSHFEKSQPHTRNRFLKIAGRLKGRRGAGTRACRVETRLDKSVPMSGDAAGMSACATLYPTDAGEKCELVP